MDKCWKCEVSCLWSRTGEGKKKCKFRVIKDCYYCKNVVFGMVNDRYCKKHDMRLIDSIACEDFDEKEYDNM